MKTIKENEHALSHVIKNDKKNVVVPDFLKK